MRKYLRLNGLKKENSRMQFSYYKFSSNLLKIFIFSFSWSTKHKCMDSKFSRYSLLKMIVIWVYCLFLINHHKFMGGHLYFQALTRLKLRPVFGRCPPSGNIKENLLCWKTFKKGLNGGRSNFKCSFLLKVFFFVNIGRCPNILDYYSRYIKDHI